MHKSLNSLSLSLINIGYASLDNSWDFDNVISPFSRMYYIDKGTARVYHHSRVFELKPGYLYLIPSFTFSRYKCDNCMGQYYLSFFEEIERGLSIYHLKSFRYEVKADRHDIINFKKLLELNPNRTLSNIDPKAYDNYPTLLSYEQKNDQMIPAQYLETQGLLLALFSRFILDTHALSNNDSLTTQKVMNTIYYINECLQEELTVNALAGRCHMNVDYYSRAFRALMGIRPVSYIQSRRIERAQLLLATTTQTLPEIASKVGLPNLAYFSRLFKKISGNSPGEFRKRQWSV